MEFLFLIAGVILGFLIAWLFLKNKSQNPDTLLLNRVAEAEKEAGILKSNLEIIGKEREAVQAELRKLQSEYAELNGKLAASVEARDNLNQRLSEQKTELEQLQDRMNKEFELLANRIIEEKSKKFTEQNRTQLEDILKPFNEKVVELKKHVNEAYDKEMRDKITLREELKKLVELNSKISEEANNLTKALKGDNKKQGNWGEMILEKVLERSGLVKDREYRTQVVTKNVDGEVIKPDVVVFLPDNKHLIIDSKVSLTAYEQLMNSDSQDERERLLKEHALSVRNHVKLLSDKNYFSSPELTSPDFVLLFMPIESSFSLAVQYDPELFMYAWDRRTVIVSPTTLLATLKTIASLWKIESQNRNALEIADQAGALYDKFEGFAKDLIEIGKKMDDAKKAYSDAMNKISDGKGNLIRRVEQLRLLGAKATKSLPPQLLNRASQDDDDKS